MKANLRVVMNTSIHLLVFVLMYSYPYYGWMEWSIIWSHYFFFITSNPRTLFQKYFLVFPTFNFALSMDDFYWHANMLLFFLILSNIKHSDLDSTSSITTYLFSIPFLSEASWNCCLCLLYSTPLLCSLRNPFQSSFLLITSLKGLLWGHQG